MSTPLGFDFCSTKTCALVGAGASLHLRYPSFSDSGEVQAIFSEALARGELYQSCQHQQNAKRLIELLGPHMGWNLERMYEHLAHMPPFLYGQQLDCNTDYLCQWLVATVAERLGSGARARPTRVLQGEMAGIGCPQGLLPASGIHH